jgi:histidinol-phosphate phosphatase family protein
MMRRVVFLDRDGTIIEDKGFLSDPAGVEILPSVVDALRLLREHGFATVIVSNQSGVARGYFDDDTVRTVNAEIARQLANDGVAIDGWYWCSHYAEDCACRKPAPGLVHRAAAELGLTLDGGAVVGDRGSDVALGHAIGVPGVLLPGPYPYEGPEPDFRAATLLEAAQWILARTLREPQGAPRHDALRQAQGDNGVAQGDNGVAQGDDGVAQGDNGVARGDNGVARGDDGVARGDNGVARGDNGVAQVTRGG